MDGEREKKWERLERFFGSSIDVIDKLYSR